MIRRLLLFPILIIAVLAGAYGALVHFYPSLPSEIRWRTLSFYRDVWLGKDLRYEGLALLRPEDIEVELPLDHSFVWWHFNQPLIKASLSANPLVQHGEVESCSRFSLRCFRIRIVEREAGFVAEVNGREWVLGEDGAFLAPVPVGRRGVDLPHVVYLAGLNSIASSPDAVTAQLSVIKDSLITLKDMTGKDVRHITLLGADEFRARFDGATYDVTLSVPKGQKELREDAERLNRILAEMKGREELIRSIDLAYHRMGVVKLEK